MIERLLLMGGMACAAMPAFSGETPPAHPNGIWKAAVPARAMHGEFDNYDAYALAIGARIKADCSLNWIDPDDGRRYCFASGTSLVYFLDSPQAHLASARARWQSAAGAH